MKTVDDYEKLRKAYYSVRQLNMGIIFSAEYMDDTSSGRTLT